MTDLTKARNFVSQLPIVQMAPDELAHHGVLGMHWGVTRSRAASGDHRAQKQLAKGDKAWEKEIGSSKGYINVHNHMAQKMNNGLIANFNKTHAKAGVDYRKDSPQSRAYFAAYEKLANKAFADSVKELYGESPSGTKKAIIEIDPGNRQPFVKIVDDNVSHADSSEKRIKLIIDSSGRIIKMGEIEEGTLAHTGVLGMHWGIRKPESVARDSREARHVRNTNRKLAVGTLGASVVVPKIVSSVRKQQLAKAANSSADHKTSRELLKKKNHELSNADIQKIVDRLQKEQKLKQLNPGSVERGKKITLGVVAAAGTAAGVYNLVKSPFGKAAISQGAKIVTAILKNGTGAVIVQEVVKTIV